MSGNSKDKYNAASPDAIYNRGEASPDYPWIRGVAGLLGDRVLVHENPEKPDEAYRETIHHDGTYEHKEALGLTSSIEKEVRRYISGGHSHNTDGNSDEKAQGNKSTDAKKDISTSSGGDNYKGHGGKEIGGSKEGGHNHTDGDEFRTSKGNVVHAHEGDLHTSHEGDQISTVIGTHYHTVVGEHGVNVQDGNYDIKVNTGKTRLDVAKNISILSHDQINMLVNEGTGTISLTALTQITLTVGNSSITMTPSGIVIKGTRIDLNP